MLHFNAPPAAALKPAAVAAEEDVYKVLILDRVTKVRQYAARRVPGTHAGRMDARPGCVCGLAELLQCSTTKAAGCASMFEPVQACKVCWLLLHLSLAAVLTSLQARRHACHALQDILAPLLHVNELRKHGVTLHMLLDAERQPIPDVPAVYFVQARGWRVAPPSRQSSQPAPLALLFCRNCWLRCHHMVVPAADRQHGTTWPAPGAECGTAASPAAGRHGKRRAGPGLQGSAHPPSRATPSPPYPTPGTVRSAS